MINKIIKVQVNKIMMRNKIVQIWGKEKHVLVEIKVNIIKNKWIKIKEWQEVELKIDDCLYSEKNLLNLNIYRDLYDMYE